MNFSMFFSLELCLKTSIEALFTVIFSEILVFLEILGVSCELLVLGVSNP